jgi:hypothetical protein
MVHIMELRDAPTRNRGAIAFMRETEDMVLCLVMGRAVSWKFLFFLSFFLFGGGGGAVHLSLGNNIKLHLKPI